MSRIFLSYRRDDSAGFAGRLADALEAEFGAGSVFRDVDDIPPGEDFVQAIQSRLREASAVLVMIGPRWLASNGEASRLHEAGDFVRKEIEAALASGKPVFPLLVGGALMPSEDTLPASIAGLARKQAVALLDSNWRGDVEKLAGSLRPLMPRDDQPDPGRRKLILGLAGGGATLLLLAFGLRHWRKPPPMPESQPVDISGRWTARVKYGWGDEHDEVFEFRNMNDRLHGSATYLTGRLVIERAKLEGEWLSFQTRSQEMLGSDNPWKEVVHRYTGQVSANEIRFTLENTGGYSIYAPMEFVARRENK